jgi:hypothetical protein
MFYFILFCDICSDMTGEHDTRNNNQMKAAVNTEHLGMAETRREEKKKIVHVTWETFYYLHTVNKHCTQNIKIIIHKLEYLRSLDYRR